VISVSTSCFVEVYPSETGLRAFSDRAALGPLAIAGGRYSAFALAAAPNSQGESGRPNAALFLRRAPTHSQPMT
jgi:hypothetical protein